MTERIQLHEHPDYRAAKADLRKFRDLYEGRHEVLAQPEYLWPHELESDATHGQKIRQIRQQRSRYLNLMEPIVSNFVALCFKKDIVVDSEVRALFGAKEPKEGEDASKLKMPEAWQNVDGKGASFEGFLKSAIATSFFRDGKVYVLTDAYENAAQSKREELEAGHRAYFELLDVLDVKDWQCDDRGKLEMLRFEYLLIEKRTSLTQAPVECRYSKLLSIENGAYTVTRYKFNSTEPQRNQKPVKGGQVDGQWELVDSVATELTELPVAAILNNEPWVQGFADLLLELHNLLSAYYNVLNYQAFQRLILAGDVSAEQIKALAEFTASIVAANTTVTVIPPVDTGPLERSIASQIDWIYKVAFNQTRALSHASAEAPSAETIREMKEELIALVKSALQDFEVLINEMVRHYALFMGQADFAGRVTLDKDITVEDVTMLLQVAASERPAIRKLEAWEKAHLKKIAALQGFSQEEMDAIRQAIEDMEHVVPTMPGMPENPGEPEAAFAKQMGDKPEAKPEDDKSIDEDDEEEGAGPGEAPDPRDR